MHRRLRPALPALLSPLVALPLAAGGDPLPLDSAPVATGIAEVLEVDGELWAVGDAYKARFDAHGITYVPALGKDAPRSLTLDLGLAKVHRGAAGLPLAGPVAAERTDDGTTLRVERDRGVLVERYGVSPEGLELSYLLHELPPGAGDLVVTLTVDTELAHPAAGRSATGLAFRGDGGVEVRVGAVTAIDAAGRTGAGELAFGAGQLSLVVPAGFLDGAELPLLVDPLISTAGVTATTDHRAPDVAYDATTDTYFATWQRWYSSTDSDIWAQRLDATGAPTGGVYSLEISIPRSGVLPCVGNVADSDRFLVCWQEQDPVTGWDIVCRAVGAFGGAASGAVTLASGFNDEEWPDVNSAIVGDDLIVVWEEENTGVRGRSVQVGPTGNPIGGATFLYSANPDDSRPAISDSTDSIGDHLIVWQRWFTTPAPGDHDLFGQRVNRFGVALGSTIYVDGLIGPDEHEPAVDGDGNRWLVAYERDPVWASLDGAVYCVAVFASGGQLFVENPATYLDDVPGVDEGAPTVAFTGEEHVVAYTSRSFVDTDLTIRVRTVDPWCGDCNDFAAIEGPHVTIGTPLGIASKFSGGVPVSSSREAVVVFSTHASFVSGGQIESARWDAEVGGKVIIGTSCSGSQAIAPCPIVGNATFTHRLIGSDPSVSSWLLLGQDPGPFVCGGGGPGSCYLALDPFTALIVSAGSTDAFGRAEVTTPLPDAAALVGLTFREQWATLPTAGGGVCPDLGVNLSQALEVTLE